ncbi:hypothetical protein QBC36DRAFT_341613 [Triangularia setosa]|uniref:Uncharacterized protein n=1 Tax=Triangularia setosa TaxID=2587417 RepID=A0AAN6VWE2_9PEZI|nr:hypothetical protein QBC36DRAFT_341613 [Podospora setosa]
MKSNLYMSELGESLDTALHGYAAARGVALDDAVLPMLERYMAELADGILATYASAQMVMARDTQSLGVVSSRCRAVRLGSEMYV